MKWQIKFSTQAEKYYIKLPSDMRKRVKKSLFELGNTDIPFLHPDVKPLLGKLDGFYRLKIGKYRIIFSIIKDIHTIAVVNIFPRGDVYKK
ncbi:MAG: type II toxin-antitoxin system RelE/ParE family toxin [Candidatus Ratteibacteria bacterium]|nr:type II toxin-antitoxin system RelE/ParE family toxin [Candidatus Ratteibacteria bacterium]